MRNNKPRYTDEPPFGWTAAGFEIYLPGDPELKKRLKGDHGKSQLDADAGTEIEDVGGGEADE